VNMQDSAVGAACQNPARARSGGLRPATTRTREIDAAAEWLWEARQVGVLAGSGAVTAEAGLRELADRTGAVVTTTLSAAGLFAGHRMDAGVCGGMGDGRALPALALCDVILAVGTSMHPLAIPELPAASRLIRIDTDAEKTAEHSDTELSLHCDAAVGVAALSELLPDIPCKEPLEKLRRIVHDYEPVDSRPWKDTEQTLDPRHALAEVLPLLPDKRGVVLGGGHAAITASQLIPPTRYGEWSCVSVDFGAIGQALPVAIGACFSQPGRRIFNITADGELMMSLPELGTAVRYNLPLTVIVLDDRGFGQERHNLRRAQLPTELADYDSTDLSALATAFGAISYRIEGPADLPQLRSALGHTDGVVVIDILVNPEYLNPASSTIARGLEGIGTTRASSR